MNAEILPVEKRDVNAKGVAIVGWSFALLLIVLSALIWFLYGPKLEDWHRLSGNYSIEKYPEPRLDTKLTPFRFYHGDAKPEFRWTDASHRFAEVPIDRAVEIAARHKLIQMPVQPQRTEP